jgi:protein SCO1/2
MGGRASLRAEAAALGALGFLLAVTAAWWALALWPVPGETPAWLARARFVCFNAGPSGLPDASGWLVLVGEPIGMLAVLMAVWGRTLRAGLRSLAAAPAGRAALALAVAAFAAGLAAAGARVARLREAPPLAAEELPTESYPRLAGPAPALGLVDQRGRRVELEALRGRPLLVTFGFGHCETFCPSVIGQTVAAQRRLRERAASGALAPERVPRVVVVTLDPWRDTPSRLPWLAEHWSLGADDLVLSGGVEEVNRALDRWRVARERDPASGDLLHPPLVYVVDASGALAYAATGGPATLAELVERS